MRFTLDSKRFTGPNWNGIKPLPPEINVISAIQHLAEFELLGVIATLHGFVTAFDILTGASESSEKDADICIVMTAFQAYISPKMPLSHYTEKDTRMKDSIIHGSKVLTYDI
jgi:hypothetical protein